MGNFLRLRKNYFLGIDFGTSSIKVVELCYKDQSVHLSNYGWLELPDRTISKEKSIKKEKTTSSELSRKAKALKFLLRKMKIKSGAANVSICSYKGLIVFLNMPNVKESELAKAIEFEATKYIPTPIKDVFLSWDIVSRQKSNNKVLGEKEQRTNMQILLVAAPKKEVKKFEQIVEKVDLDVNSLELDIFSLGRSLARSKEKVYLIVDMGAKVTNIILMDSGTIKINHSLNVGGDEITKEISSAMNISWSRAEKFKKNSENILNNKDIPLRVTLNIIINEIGKVLALHKKNNGTKVETVVISGGVAQIKDADKYFTSKLNLLTILGNPWDKIIIADQKITDKSFEIASIFATATGLALKGIEQYRRDK